MQLNLQNWLKDLANICRNNLNSAYVAVTYPVSIIPSIKYKQYIEIDNLISENEFVIVRRSEKSKSDTFDEFGWLREDALISGYDSVPGLSMNVLGGKFQVKHISFNPKGIAAKEWVKDKDSFLWFRYIWKATLLKITTPIYYKISDLHKKQFPYHKTTDKNFNKLMANLPVKPLIVGGKAHCFATSIIKHSPNKLNYWHIEFHLNDGIKPEKETIKTSQVKNKNFDDNQLAKINDTPWADQIMFFALRDCLIAKAQENFKETDFNIINEKHYISK